MATKKENSMNEVSNLEGAAMSAPVAEVPTTEPVVDTPETQPEMSELEKAQAEIARVKAMMDEAKKKLAEAKKANTKSRPVRMSTFVLTTEAEPNLEITKTDVHYCAEKAAIDILAEDLKCGNTTDTVYIVWKRDKTEATTQFEVERLWIDQETNQIVIK